MSPDPPNPCCPRCGYDQRGHFAAWTDACPVEGTCVECGLVFAWSDVLSKDAVPQWCVEYDQGRLVRPRQVFLTLVHTMWPLEFWSRLKMTGRERPGRIVVYLVALLLVLYLLFAMTIGIAMAKESSRYRRFVTTPVSPWSLFVHGATKPLSGKSIGAYTSVNGRRFPISAPFMHTRLLAGTMQGVLILGLAAHLSTAVAFAVLPVSRRRAKVRFVHLVRVTLYGLAWCVPVVVVGLLAFGLGVDDRPPGYLLLVGPPVLVAWWWTAIARYLRMEHVAAVTLAVVAIGLLVPAAFGHEQWIPMIVR